MINRLEPGDRQISASGWNEMRDIVNNISPGQNTVLTGSKNPFLINAKNNSSSNLTTLSVVKISGATYGSRTEAVFREKGGDCGTEVNVATPDSEDNNIAILQEAIKAGGIGKAIADGCTAAFVYKETADHTYKYAKPVQSRTDYLRACDEATNIRVLWHGMGSGKVNAYICLDATGASTPLKCADRLNSASDEYPDGATQLPTTRTWIYCSAIDKIKAKDDHDAPYVYNPLGLPLDRPTIVAKVDGFPGEAEVPEGSSRHIGDYVAVGSDVRDYFIINPGGGYSGNNPTTNENGSPNDYYAKGNVFYTSEGSNDYTVIEGAHYDPTIPVRIGVCQQDMPYDWYNKFRMASFSPESNMGRPIANTFPSNVSLTRCGLAPEDQKFSQKRLDYLYSHGRYAYDPIFVYKGTAKGEVGGNNNVYIELNGEDYIVEVGDSYYCALRYDIYPGDTITVLVDASEYFDNATTFNHGIRVQLVEGPMDFKEGTTILAASSPGRGWTDVTPTVPANNYYTVGGGGFATVGSGTDTAYFLDSGFKWWQKNKDGAIR